MFALRCPRFPLFLSLVPRPFVGLRFQVLGFLVCVRCYKIASQSTTPPRTNATDGVRHRKTAVPLNTKREGKHRSTNLTTLSQTLRKHSRTPSSSSCRCFLLCLELVMIRGRMAVKDKNRTRCVGIVVCLINTHDQECCNDSNRFESLLGGRIIQIIENRIIEIIEPMIRIDSHA